MYFKRILAWTILIAAFVACNIPGGQSYALSSSGNRKTLLARQSSGGNSSNQQQTCNTTLYANVTGESRSLWNTYTATLNDIALGIANNNTRLANVATDYGGLVGNFTQSYLAKFYTNKTLLNAVPAAFERYSEDFRAYFIAYEKNNTSLNVNNAQTRLSADALAFSVLFQGLNKASYNQTTVYQLITTHQAAVLLAGRRYINDNWQSGYAAFFGAIRASSHLADAVSAGVYQTLSKSSSSSGSGGSGSGSGSGSSGGNNNSKKS